MSEPLDWPTIKLRYPELRDRLVAGDISARVEFARLAFGGEIISEIYHADQPQRPQHPSESPSPRTATTQKASRVARSTEEPQLDIAPEQSPNPPF